MAHRNVLRTLGIIAVAVMGLDARTIQTPETPAFEVASVKPSKSENGRGASFPPGGRFTATDLTPRELIALAYDIPNPFRNIRISDGPGWIDSARFDIVAKGEANSSPERVRLMLRALLANRFKLVARNQVRERPIYALVLARSDRRLGPQLRRSDLDCAARGNAPLAPIPSDPNVAPPCVMRQSPGHIVASATTMSNFVAMGLSRFVEDRLVVDRTGLTGRFDLSLEWTPASRGFGPPPVLPPGLPEPAPPHADGPSIFTAVEEQLGLKLQPTTGAVEVLVIEHVEHPTED